MAGLRQSYEYIYEIAKPDEPGEVLGIFIFALIAYFIIKIVAFLKEANLINKIPYIGKKITFSEECFEGLQIFARIWKIAVLVTAAKIAYDQVVNEDLINLELQICLVAIAGFEIIDECYNFAIDLRNKK